MGARLVLKITEKQTGRRIAVYIHWGSEGMSSVWNIESFAEAYAKKINHSRHHDYMKLTIEVLYDMGDGHQ